MNSSVVTYFSDSSERSRMSFDIAHSTSLTRWSLRSFESPERTVPIAPPSRGTMFESAANVSSVASDGVVRATTSCCSCSSPCFPSPNLRRAYAGRVAGECSGATLWQSSAGPSRRVSGRGTCTSKGSRADRGQRRVGGHPPQGVHGSPGPRVREQGHPDPLADVQDIQISYPRFGKNGWLTFVTGRARPVGDVMQAIRPSGRSCSRRGVRTSSMSSGKRSSTRRHGTATTA